jgi:hypothetical protein
MTVTQNGQVYSKTISNMVTATTCPSIYDCNNPAELPKNEWSLIYVDSEETNYPGLAVMSFDNDPSTIWHTRWSTGDDPYPHEIQVALGRRFEVHEFTYLTRQDGENGRIKMYQLYIGMDSLNWGTPVKQGQFVNTSAPQTIVFDPPVEGKYFRLVGLNEVNGNPWASAAEFSIVGCTEPAVGMTNIGQKDNLFAFPVPTDGMVTVSLPGIDSFRYKVVSVNGQIMHEGALENSSGNCSFDLGNLSPGVYFLLLTNEAGISYRVKAVKN